MSNLQSSCTKPELETEGADVEQLKGLSQLKRIKSLSNDISVPTRGEYHQENENLLMADTDTRGNTLMACLVTWTIKSCLVHCPFLSISC